MRYSYSWNRMPQTGFHKRTWGWKRFIRPIRKGLPGLKWFCGNIYPTKILRVSGGRFGGK